MTKCLTQALTSQELREKEVKGDTAYTEIPVTTIEWNTSREQGIHQLPRDSREEASPHPAGPEDSSLGEESRRENTLET